jgi:hypothetical protein
MSDDHSNSDKAHRFFWDVERGDYSLVSESLRAVLTAVLKLNYSVVTVSVEHASGRIIEIILDRPISRDVEQNVPSNDDIVCFDDLSSDGSISGIGFYCRSSGQSVCGQTRPNGLE